MSHVASTPTPSLDPTPSVAPVMPAPSSNWRAPLCSLRSAAFGVAGSVAAKLALTDSWTHWIADHIADAWRANALTSSSPAEASDQQIETDEWNKQLLFYTVRASLVLLKLYLDSRMLHYFVRSMHASNSLLASTFNQCSSIILAGICGLLLFSESLPSSWLVGVAFIIVGVCFVQWGSSDQETTNEQQLQIARTADDATEPATTHTSSELQDDVDEPSPQESSTRSLRSRQSTASRQPPSTS